MREGVTLVGRYRLEERLGQGAMGVVWKAFDLRLDREVAVKILPDHLSDEPRKIERFLAEAKIGAALQHPGIVVVFDVDEHEGRRFFVMELLAGEDLAKTLSRSRNGLPISKVVRMSERLADALAAAHAKNVVHRDIKPANVMVLPGERTKICDFGVARIKRDSVGQGTSGIGTAAYMAPEQFNGRLDERADLYSLGCVMYEMLTGDQPFIGGNVYQLMYQHAEAEPTLPSTIRGETPSVLEELVLELMTKDPNKRPQKASEVVARLKAIRVETRAEKPIPSKAVTLVDAEPPCPTKTRQLYQRPPMQFLKSGSPGRRRTDDNDATARAIGQVLTEASMDAKVTGGVRGPSCSRYEIRLGSSVSPEEIIALAPQVAQAVGNTAVRIVPMPRSTSPLPDVRAVVVEVPHAKLDIISVGDVLRDVPAVDADSPLLVGLGRDIDGLPVTVDLARAPHLLIGGAARNAGADPVHTLITSVLMQAGADEVRMLLVDGQAGRLASFEGLPHLVEPIVTTPQASVETLQWAVAELDRRYDDLAAAGCRTVGQYNEGVYAGRVPIPLRRLGDALLPHPFILLVIGELAEVVRAARGPVETALVQLTRLGRAVGIHVVLRTAHFDEHTLTSRIRAYVPSRLGLPAPSSEASLRLLDHAGAESLRAGEALFRPGGGDPPSLLYLAQVSDEEIAAVTDHCRRQG
ncbi:DNA translocase FtsK [Planomonospora algeriensis]